MTGETKPVRIPLQVGLEVRATALVLDMSAAEVLEQAWNHFKASPEFKEQFLSYQEAFASGDLESIATELHRRSVERAVERAATANE